MDPVAVNRTLGDMASSVGMTEPQFIKFAHDLTATPTLIIIFLVTHALFLIIGLSLFDKKNKFLKVWGFTLLFSGIALLVLIYLPNVTQQFMALFK